MNKIKIIISDDHRLIRDGIKSMLASLKFILLTMHEEPEYIIKAVKGVGSGYLLKNLEYEELEKAVLTVAAGGKYFNDRISKILLENLYANAEEEAINDKLTERELGILSEIVGGLTTKQIAEKLFISHRTVETHRVNLMRFYGAMALQSW